MAQPERQTLRQALAGAAGTKRMLWGGRGAVVSAYLVEDSALRDSDASAPLNRSGERMRSSLPPKRLSCSTALRARIIVCPPDPPLAHLATTASEAEADAIVTDRDEV